MSLMDCFVLAVQITPPDCECSKCPGHKYVEWQEAEERRVVCVQVHPARRWADFAALPFVVQAEGRTTYYRAQGSAFFAAAADAYEEYHKRYGITAKAVEQKSQTSETISPK